MKVKCGDAHACAKEEEERDSRKWWEEEKPRKPTI